jgi:hypothetical protein
MRRIVAAAVLLAAFSFAGQVSAESKKVYIKAFAGGDGIYGTGMADEIKDYMAEVFVKQLSLITDDEIKEYLSNTELAEAVTADSENASSKLLKSIDVNYLVYGKIYKDSGDYVIDATMLELNADNTVTKKNFGDIRFSKPIYLDRASRSLARFLLGDRKKILAHSIFGPSDPRDGFKKEIHEAEEEMMEMESDFRSDVASITKASRRRDEILSNSPLFRIGYGGIGTVGIESDYLSKIYGNGQGVIADYFFYRYKDPVGDGIDMYCRALVKQYKIKSSALSSVKTNEAKYYVGRFESTPSTDSTMLQYGGDLGLRFVGSVYFLAESWSLYTSGAIRYLMTDERYTADGKDYRKRLAGWGFVGGAGVEVSLFTNFGLFAEADYSYSPIGRSGTSVGGFEAFSGVTFRTNHWF